MQNQEVNVFWLFKIILGVPFQTCNKQSRLVNLSFEELYILADLAFLCLNGCMYAQQQAVMGKQMATETRY